MLVLAMFPNGATGGLLTKTDAVTLMSIQAVAWALEQDFSYKTPKGHVRCCHAAKLVLISLANHADHTSGHCWPSAETIAREASCAVKTVYRLVAALARNGFVEIKKARGEDGKQRSNNYWILFDRKPSEWQFYAGDEPDDDGGEPGNPEPGNTASPGENAPGNLPENANGLPGPGNIQITRHIMLEPSVLEPSESEQVDSTREAASPPPAPPQPLAQADKPKAAERTKPHGFDPNARRRELERLKAAEEARKPALIPVIEGSEPWFAWLKYKNPQTGRCHPPTLTTTIDVKGRSDRGWYFPTLWPPKETGPPGQAPPLPLPKTG